MTLDSLEAFIADVWSHEFGLTAVSRNDNFFDLGGNSIGAIRIIGKLNDELCVNLSIGSLFSAAVLSDFAKVVHSFLGENTSPT